MIDMSEVIHVGTDSGGRELWMTRYMWAWWQGVKRHLDFEPTIVQGAWMDRFGGGVAASGGFHNFGGCLDVRTWDLSTAQELSLNRVVRLGGAGGWRRYPSQGFDVHYHLVLGTDPGIGADAALQWRNYLAGDAGLVGSQRDYEWRPDPMVTTPPSSYMSSQDGFDMAEVSDLRNLTEPLNAKLDLLLQRTEGLRVAHGEIVAALDALAVEVSDDASAELVRRARDRVIAAITANP